MRHVKAILAVVAAIVLNTGTLNRAFGEEVDDLDHEVSPYSCFECYSDIFGAVSPIKPDRDKCLSWRFTIGSCRQQCFREGDLQIKGDRSLGSIVQYGLAGDLWLLLTVLCIDAGIDPWWQDPARPIFPPDPPINSIDLRNGIQIRPRPLPYPFRPYPPPD